MAGYIAGRPCVFRGEKYLIGDLIPFEAVDPSREKVLIDSGHITKLPEPVEPAEPQRIAITIGGKQPGEKIGFFFLPEEIKQIFDIWHMNVEDANTAIKAVKNKEVLEVVKQKETRKGVLEGLILALSTEGEEAGEA